MVPVHERGIFSKEGQIMQWFYNVLSWHFACMALALLVLGITPLTAKVRGDNPPPTTSIGSSPGPCGGCSGNNGPCALTGCNYDEGSIECAVISCYDDIYGGCDC